MAFNTYPYLIFKVIASLLHILEEHNNENLVFGSTDSYALYEIIETEIYYLYVGKLANLEDPITYDGVVLSQNSKESVSQQ